MGKRKSKETDYLLSTKANGKHLARSIDQVNKSEIKMIKTEDLWGTEESTIFIASKNANHHLSSFARIIARIRARKIFNQTKQAYLTPIML